MRAALFFLLLHGKILSNWINETKGGFFVCFFIVVDMREAQICIKDFAWRNPGISLGSLHQRPLNRR